MRQTRWPTICCNDVKYYEAGTLADNCLQQRPPVQTIVCNNVNNVRPCRQLSATTSALPAGQATLKYYEAGTLADNCLQQRPPVQTIVCNNVRPSRRAGDPKIL